MHTATKAPGHTKQGKTLTGTSKRPRPASSTPTVKVQVSVCGTSKGELSYPRFFRLEKDIHMCVLNKHHVGGLSKQLTIKGCGQGPR